jgi:gamma-glutamylcyclotransferase (GGCT)/AIG2-like uncharacterized protein YtfP
MNNLFAYGTLKDKDIQETIFGRLLKGTPDALQGYQLDSIQIEEEFGVASYPIIVPNSQSESPIEGVVYEITDHEIQLADTYEGISYKRTQVQLQSGKLAWVYIITR